MRVLRSLILTLLLVTIIIPSASAAATTPGPDLRFVETMMEDWDMTEKAAGLVAITSDTQGKHIGMLFRSGNRFRIYKNGKLIHDQKVVHADDVHFFRMTEDGNLLYVLDPYDLYVNGKRISTSANDYAYTVGLDLKDLYRRGAVTFIDGNMIREYTVSNERSRILYTHAGDIAYLRRVGSDLYYSAYENVPEPGYYIFKNGKKQTYVATSDPVHFAVSGARRIYFFTQGGSSAVLYENDKPYHSTEGRGTFIYIGTANGVLDAVVRSSNSGSGEVVLFRNGKQVNERAIYGIEGSIAFRGAQYATRVQPSALEPETFRLMKNGKMIGEPFAFGSMRDENGVQFGPGGKTYMRNIDNGRWRLYEDGSVTLKDAFQHVLFFSATPKGLLVFGTRPKR